MSLILTDSNQNSYTVFISEAGVTVHAPEEAIVGVRYRKGDDFFLRIEYGNKTLIYSDVYDTYGSYPLREYTLEGEQISCVKRQVDDREFRETWETYKHMRGGYSEARAVAKAHSPRFSWKGKDWKMIIPDRQIYLLDFELGL